MKLSTFLAAAFVATAAVPAGAATVSSTYDVVALTNTTVGTPLATGLTFAAGETFTVTAGTGDTWSMDVGLPWKDSNADGNDKYYQFTTGNLNEWVGKLVGLIGTTYFSLGTDVTVTAPVAGELYLLVWDNNPGDNGGSIAVTVSQTSPVPLPASALLLLGGLGGIATLRRKRAA